MPGLNNRCPVPTRSLCSMKLRVCEWGFIWGTVSWLTSPAKKKDSIRVSWWNATGGLWDDIAKSICPVIPIIVRIIRIRTWRSGTSMSVI